MELSAEDRVNMSLDDLIKNQKKTKKPMGDGSGKGKPRGPRQQRNPKQRTSEGVPADKNIAKVIGTSKAKRSAAANQRRGLNPTGKATKREINSAINAQSSILSKSSGRKNMNGGGVPGRKSPINRRIPVAGLKISFNPNQLSQTTDKTVSQQIRAALQKQNVKKDVSRRNAVPVAAILKENTTRQVVVAGGRGAGRGNGSRNGRGGGRK